MRYFVSTLMTLAGVASALAADLPPPIYKAPPALFAYQSSGWYVGMETGAAVANEKGSGLFANNLVSGNLTAAGGVVGGCVGYLRGGAASAWGVKSCGDYQNITAGGIATNGAVSRWSASSEVQFFGNFFSWIQHTVGNLGVNVAFPTFPTPPVSGDVHLAAAPHNYLAAGVKAQGVSGSFGSAGGGTVAVAPMIKAGAVWQTLDATGRPNGGAIDVSAEVALFKKGTTITGLFANGGGLGTGHAEMGTTYTAKIGYLFAVGR